MPLERLLRQCATDEEAELLAERAMLVYAFLSYAYLRSTADPTPTWLPPSLAAPWHAAARHVGRTPQLDYVTTVLTNVSLDDATHRGALNAAPTATFSGLSDEQYFYTLHARIEQAGGGAIGAMMEAEAARARGALDGPALLRALQAIAPSVRAMAELMPLMTDGCGPVVFHSSIRDPLSGFKKGVRFGGGTADAPSARTRFPRIARALP